MADDRRYELEDLTIRPGTYFNPQTEVLVVVDDSPSMDNEIFNLEEFEGADWVLISDDVPVDEDARDQLLETLPGHVPRRRRPPRRRVAVDGGRAEPELEPDPRPRAADRTSRTGA